jgi:hypothetical protein
MSQNYLQLTLIRRHQVYCMHGWCAFGIVQLLDKDLLEAGSHNDYQKCNKGKPLTKCSDTVEYSDYIYGCIMATSATLIICFGAN